jgi:tRNA(Ile)-lysidine synthase
MKRAEQFLSRFLEFNKENKLFKQGETILVGFSGGADSTALLHALLSLRHEFNLHLLSAHVNYHLRGKESEADMKFVKEFCFRHSISLVIREEQIKKTSDIENRARTIRFQFFHSLVKDYKINKVALGHNKNDLAETMLLHLFRGSGITGMKGIQPKNDNIIRPLLCFSREEIVAYLKGAEVSHWRSDSSNENTIYMRNKVRNSLIPWLEENVNQKIIDLLYQNSVIFREADEFLNDSVNRIFKKLLINQQTDEIRLDISKLENRKEVILYYVFRKCLKMLTGKECGFYHNHLKEISSLLGADGSKMITLPDGIVVLKEYNQLVFQDCSSKNPAISEEEESSQVIDITKKFHIFNKRRILCKRISKNDITAEHFIDPDNALIDLDKLSLPLTIGYRKEGDKFIPIGMKGTKKLKDFFIDEKISKFERGKILIFRDQEKIVWIGGLRLDERLKIDEQTKNVLSIRIEEIKIRSRKSVLKKKKDRGIKDDQRHFSNIIG